MKVMWEEGLHCGNPLKGKPEKRETKKKKKRRKWKKNKKKEIFKLLKNYIFISVSESTIWWWFIFYFFCSFIHYPMFLFFILYRQNSLLKWFHVIQTQPFYIDFVYFLNSFDILTFFLLVDSHIISHFPLTSPLLVRASLLNLL